MFGHHLYTTFVKGAGRQRAGRQARGALNKAIASLERAGEIAVRSELGVAGYRDAVLRPEGTPVAVVRPRGPREFLEIPPSELAVVVKRAGGTDTRSREALFRSVLDFYDTKRMTEDIQSRLNFVCDQLDSLVAGD